MSDAVELNAEVRDDMGKGASRRLRHNGKIPAIVYGAGKKPVALTLVHDDLAHALENEAFYSQIINLKVGKKKEKVILKDLQRHSWKPLLAHADFLRIKMDEMMTTNVPLHFLNEDNCEGVKNQGGQITHLMNDIEITCLPTELPEFIEVDVAALELGATIHLSDITAPEGIEFSALGDSDDEVHDLGLVSVIKKKEDTATEATDETGSEAEGNNAEGGDTDESKE